MLDWLFLLAKGTAVGFAIAAPVGPVGVLCVRRTLMFGRVSGLVSGFGAAVADALYGCVAAFGLTLISGWLLDHRVAIQLIGGTFLLFLAWRILAMGQGERGGAAAATDNDSSVLHSFGSTFALTLTNPITILAFLGIFTAVGIAEVSHDRWLAAALVAGVFIGSMAWWLFLAAGAGYFRRHLQGGGLRWVNRISGFLMLAFGLYALVELAINLTKGP
ncbi:LysE family translocator [Marinibaculum pumilum]|uniref:LysE family translocator n=1 Tax=Marinibaculum pumilum TaxID=1766165 RepID=A0ABV7L826_9PROT